VIVNKKKLDCPHFNACSGCQLQDDIESPPILLRARQFFKERGINELLCKTGSIKGWRYRSKLAVRGSSSKPLIGLYKEYSHEVVEIPHCVVHHPSINEAIRLIKKQISLHQIAPYNENEGDLRYLQCVVERRTQKMQLALVVNAERAPDNIKALMNSLFTQNPDKWHSIWINYHPTASNRIFGEEWELFHGERFLWEEICGTPICFLPGSFGQANLDLFEQMLQEIQINIPKHSKILEFYAGVGAIGLPLAAQSQWVKCVEINPQAKICFDEAKKKMPEQTAAKLDYRLGSASDPIDVEFLSDADIVIVDPPRKGIDKELLLQLKAASQPKKLIYISCGWNSFEKDASQLIDAGWHLKKATAYLFFPGCDHLETLAFLEKLE